MENRFLHTFRLVVEGLPDPVTFQMFHEAEDVATVTDAFARYVARQEDDFLPVGEGMAVRANRVLSVSHAGCERGPDA